ncbi:MAG: methylated-DNA--[protein]-cysteine S-methyltransferase [Candidatus Krumholzibacteriia bacterium]
MTTILTHTHPSPLGPLGLESDGTALLRIRLPGEKRPAPDGPPRCAAPAAFTAVIAQLDEYFAGARTAFDLPLAPAGTPFQRRVWALLQAIPYGQTITYAELARRAGNPAACRAVGAANGRNPLPVVVPCHRVIGSGGRLTGYAGGLAAKARLLALEGVAPARTRR